MSSITMREQHRTHNIGWLRAAVLGANDGILSTSSLVLGVASAHGTHSSVLAAGIAGLVSGAMAMAAGEYVSVHSQADTEEADIGRERSELKADDSGEHAELTAIYVERGLDAGLARQVADQLMAQRQRRPQPRRTGSFGGNQSTPRTGCFGLSGQFCGWRSHAAAGDRSYA